MVNKTPPIIYVRHGETDWNRQGLIQGSIDTDLNERGHAQAKAVAALLAGSNHQWADYQVIVSPLKRTRQTANYIMDAIGRADHQLEPRVRELSFGIWEAKPFWELKASPVYPPHPEDRFSWRPEGGESYEDGIARVKDWLGEVAKPTLVVSHGGIGRCLMGMIGGLPRRDLVSMPTPQGCYCVLQDGQINWFDGT